MADVQIAVPHAGVGTHTIVAAVEVDDDRLGDLALAEDVAAELARLVDGLLARHRGGQVLTDVLDRHDLTLPDLLGPRRDRPAVLARQEAMWQLRQAGWSLPKIGHLLHRDHTTVLSGVRAHQSRVLDPVDTDFEVHDPDKPCDDCGDRPAMAGGAWCLPCFQNHSRARAS